MQKIDWYFTSIVAIWTLVVLVILVSFRSIGVLVDELGSVGRADYGTLQAVYVVLLRTPNFVHEVFPVSLLLGGLLGFGGMAKNNEIIAMRAAGIPVWRMFKAALKAGLLLVTAGVLLGELLAPPLQHKSDQLKAHWLDYPTLLQSKYGVWLRDEYSFVNIERIRPTGELNNISIYTFDEAQRLRSMTHGASAVLQQGQWILSDVRETRLDAAQIETAELPSKPMLISFDAGLIKNLSIEPDMLSIMALHQYNSFLAGNQISIPEYEIAFWSRLAVPVLGMLMLVLALPFTLVSMRNIDIAKRLTAGAIFGVVVFLTVKSANFAGVVYGLPPMLVAWGPVLLLALGLVIYIRRIA